VVIIVDKNRDWEGFDGFLAPGLLDIRLVIGRPLERDGG
jgi:hypothetical protein